MMVQVLIKLQHLSYLSVDKWGTIVTYNSIRYPKSDNNVFFDEVHHSSSRGFTEWYGLCPFGKVFRSYKDPYVPIRRWINWSH